LKGVNILKFNSKQRALIRKQASKIDPLMRIGKDGISDNVIQSLNDLFRKRELVKVKLLQNTESEIREAAEKLSEGAGAKVVHIMGKTIVLYKENEEKPDISIKLKEIK
jgi:RNA-binding protein